MTAKSFVRAVKKRSEEDAPKPIVVDLSTYDEDPDGEPLFDTTGQKIMDEDGEQVVGFMRRQLVLHATQPSDDAMLVSFVQAGRADASAADKAALIFDMLKAALPAGEYADVIRRVKDPHDELDTELLTEVFEYLEEEWARDTGFPTESPSGSSARRQSSGKSSTGRSPGAGSTRSR